MFRQVPQQLAVLPMEGSLVGDMNGDETVYGRRHQHGAFLSVTQRC